MSKVMFCVDTPIQITREEIPIDTLIKQLKELKSVGATHVDLDPAFYEKDNKLLLAKTWNLCGYKEVEVKDKEEPDIGTIDILQTQIGKLQALEEGYYQAHLCKTEEVSPEESKAKLLEFDNGLTELMKEDGVPEDEIPEIAEDVDIKNVDLSNL